MVGPPTSPHGDGQGITAKRPLSWGISCMERCARTLGLLVHVPVNPFGKKPAGPCPAPARWPHGCRSGEPGSSVLAQPVPWEQTGKEQLWLTTHSGTSPSCGFPSPALLPPCCSLCPLTPIASSIPFVLGILSDLSSGSHSWLKTVPLAVWDQAEGASC